MCELPYNLSIINIMMAMCVFYRALKKLTCSKKRIEYESKKGNIEKIRCQNILVRNPMANIKLICCFEFCFISIELLWVFFGYDISVIPGCFDIGYTLIGIFAHLIFWEIINNANESVIFYLQRRRVSGR